MRKKQFTLECVAQLIGLSGFTVYAAVLLWWKYIVHEPEHILFPVGMVIFAALCLLMLGATLMLIHLGIQVIRKLKNQSEKKRTQPTDTADS